jgi:hypothetical protein
VGGEQSSGDQNGSVWSFNGGWLQGEEVTKRGHFNLGKERRRRRLIYSRGGGWRGVPDVVATTQRKTTRIMGRLGHMGHKA